MKRLITLVLVASVLFSLSAIGQPFLNNRLVFQARLNGDQENPPVSTNATGLATLIVSEDLTQVEVFGVFNGLSGPVTGCHIHNGTQGSNGGVAFDFTSSVDVLGRLRATFAVTPDFFEKALTQAYYLNVHTAANPNGEIRGQFELQTDNAYGVVLTGDQEVPAVNTAASGVGFLTFSPGGFTARYLISVNGLSGPVTASHIHSGAAGANGGVVVGLDAPGIFIQGEIDLTAVPADFTQKLEDEGLYVNVHTTANPNGEIRGQLRSLGPIHFEMVLNGDQEVPPVATGGSGAGIAAISPDLSTVEYAVVGTGLSGPVTAAHFHQGPAGQAGGVLLPLQAATQPNLFRATVALPPGGAALLLNSGVYANLHTVANPGGEIRGQVTPELRHAYVFDMCGLQEAPQSSSNGVGIGFVTHNFLNTHLNYRFLTNGLSGPITAAHFHEGGFGTSGGVLSGLLTTAVGGSGQFPIDGNFAVQFFNENAYLNVHTDNFPNGEIRGQVVLQTDVCAGIDAASETPASAASLAPNPAHHETFLRFNSDLVFEGRLNLFSALGQRVLASRHEVFQGENVLRIELGQLAPGVYFGTLQSENGMAASFRLVKE